MVRRTKLDAAQTRLAIIDAARDVFQARGVTSTRLEDIAQTAGVTRGAIYWHFANKNELFYAMRDQVTLPMVDKSNFELLQQKHFGPLVRIENFARSLLEMLTQNPVMRTSFEIMQFKCEYVGEFHQERLSMRDCHNDLLDLLTRVYRQAARDGSLRASLDPKLMALDTMMFLVGLCRMSLMQETNKVNHQQWRKAIAAHMALRQADHKLKLQNKSAIDAPKKTARKKLAASNTA